jgi:hypothetical protein
MPNVQGRDLVTLNAKRAVAFAAQSETCREKSSVRDSSRQPQKNQGIYRGCFDQSRNELSMQVEHTHVICRAVAQPCHAAKNVHVREQVRRARGLAMLFPPKGSALPLAPLPRELFGRLKVHH